MRAYGVAAALDLVLRFIRRRKISPKPSVISALVSASP